MSETACCAHSRIEHKNNETGGRVTREWWECRDCKTEFVPEPEIRDLRQRLEETQFSMVRHFETEHLAGDGPEIDRWKQRLKEAEKELADFKSHDHAPCIFCDPLRSELTESRRQREEAEKENARLREALTGIRDLTFDIEAWKHSSVAFIKLCGIVNAALAEKPTE